MTVAGIESVGSGPNETKVASSTYTVVKTTSISNEMMRTYASSVFMMNGLASVNVSNRPILLGLQDKEELSELSDGLIFSFDAGLCAGASDSDLTPARGCIRFSGMSVVCTGVMPPNEALPPQNALDGEATR